MIHLIPKETSSLIILTALLCLNLKLFSQNLVPNPSFEDTLQCPSTITQISSCENWSNYAGSCDYYHECSDIVGVPYSPFYGYQEPVTGVSFAAITTFWSLKNQYREFLGCQLIEPLVVNETYYFSFYIVRGNRGDTHQMASNGQGILFSMEEYSIDSPLIPNNSAHYINEEVLLDTVNWIPIRGSIVPSMPYEYLAIGNFLDDENTSTIDVGEVPDNSYYLIDEVRVSTDSVFVYENLTNNVINMNQSDFLTYPNPFSDFINLSNSEVLKSVKLYNIHGKQILKFKKEELSERVDLSFLSCGVYFLEVETFQGLKWIKRIIKN